jgi:hypothetical protein
MEYSALTDFQTVYGKESFDLTNAKLRKFRPSQNSL